MQIVIDTEHCPCREACWLWEDGNCAKEVLYEKMKAESEVEE